MPKPEKAEYPYWAFLDPRSVDLSGGGVLSRLLVPVSEVLFFDAWDWYKVLRLSYIGENEEEEKAFSRHLSITQQIFILWGSLFRRGAELCLKRLLILKRATAML